VAAVEEGRVVYDNILKFVAYLLTTNTGEVLMVLISLLLGLPLPLLPVHLLWTNLITDGLPALALGFEPAEKNVMQRSPRRRDEGMFTSGFVLTILGAGLLMAILCTGVFVTELYAAHRTENDAILQARTMAFYTLSTAQLFYVLGIRSFTETIFELGLWTNYRLTVAVAVGFCLQVLVVQFEPIGVYLHTVPLSAGQLALSTAVAMLPAIATEFWKWTMRGPKTVTNA